VRSPYEEIGMKSGLIVVGALFLLAIPSAARSQNTSQSAQDKTSADKSATAQSDKAQIVGTAEITKIDAKKQMLTVKNIQSASTGNPNGSGAGSGRRQGGGGSGGVGFPGGGRRRGGGYPGGGGRPPSGGGQSQAGQPKEYKVYVTKDTVIKLANADLEFSDLHVGDRIAVAGTPKNGSGGDLQASTITRDPQ
jgi:hypothetical protein